MRRETLCYIGLGTFLGCWLLQFTLPYVVHSSPMNQLAQLTDGAAVNFILLNLIFAVLAFAIVSFSITLHSFFCSLRLFRPRIGDILIRGGHITQEQLRWALSLQKMRIGELLVHLGCITETELNDALSRQVAAILLQPGALRDRLTEGVYIPDDDREPVARLEAALQKAVIAEPLLHKLRTAMKNGKIARGDPETRIDAGLTAGVITEVEANAIRAAIAARKVVIQVDAFEPEYFTKEQRTWGESKLDGVAGRSL